METYSVWCPEYGQTRDDAREFKAWIPEDAAKEWGHWSDSSSSDYTIANGNEIEVLVALGDADAEAFIVSAEPSIDYFASKKRGAARVDREGGV